MTELNTFYLKCKETDDGNTDISIFSSDPAVSKEHNDDHIHIGCFHIDYCVCTYALLQQCDVIEIDRTENNRSVTLSLHTDNSIEECANKLKECLNG